MMRRLQLWVLGVGAVALMSAGCGDDTKDPADTGGTDTVDDVSDTNEDTSIDAGDTGSDAGDTSDVGGDVVTPPMGCAGQLPTHATDLCVVEAGADNALLLQGNIILPTGIQERGQVLVVDGYITCSGCDCIDAPEAATATKISCAEGVISPGLINAHDHITFTEGAPAAHPGSRYDHRHEWRKGKDGKYKIPSPSNSHSQGEAWGEMRQVMGGATSMFGSGAGKGFQRNLDRHNSHEGINHDQADYDTFPLGDSSGRIIASGCGDYNLPDSDIVNQLAWAPHVAEGIVDGARNEFLCLTGLANGAVDVLEDNVAHIHGIGVTASDIVKMAGRGGALIWSPRSNTDLYGFTADVPLYRKLGVRIGIGTDWTYSGSMNLLRELQCAEDWNALWDNSISDQDLVNMATIWNAEVLGFDDVIGSLTSGKAADIAIWDGRINTGYRAILDAEVNDIALVLRGGSPLVRNGNTYFRRGTPLYGDSALVDELADRELDYADYDPAVWNAASNPLPAACEEFTVCGTTKKMCVAEQLERKPNGAQYYEAWSLERMTTELSGAYDLFFCDVPDDEPSCVPWRDGEFTGVPTGSDQDGDGIADGDDNCPAYFNAVRPMDMATGQPDTDDDGVGDTCDVCPMDADTDACSSANPDDVDNDGWLNTEDNCPGVANEDQLDGDSDDIGDVCDACPDFDNTGGLPCPATIYDIKDGTRAVDTSALIQDAIVSAIGGNFITVQVQAGSAGWTGVDYAGLYVYMGSLPMPAVGDIVDVIGNINEFYGQIQVAASNVVVKSSGDAPAATIVAPADIAPGGAKEAAYEALLVTVEDVVCTDDAPAGEDGETVVDEFLVTGGLTVGSQLFLLEPFPTVDSAFDSVTGILRRNWNRNKLLPRDAADVVLGDAGLWKVTPDESWIYVGDTVTAPEALTVYLTAPADGETLVAVTSSDVAVLTVEGGGATIADGALSGDFTVTPVAAGTVTLTATFGDKDATIVVNVLAADHVPTLVSADASGSTVLLDATFQVTVTLDVPAGPAGVSVAVAAAGSVTTVPMAIDVDPGATTATADFVASDVEGDITIDLTLGTDAEQLIVAVTDAQPVRVLWCFDDGSAFNVAPNVDTAVTASTYSLGAGLTQANFAGNTQNPKPADCPAGDTDQSTAAAAWDSAASFNADSDKYMAFTVTHGPADYILRFDERASGSGPQMFAVWSSSEGLIVEDMPTTNSFGPSPMQTISLGSLGGLDNHEIRIYGYNAGGGTWRLDNVELLMAP